MARITLESFKSLLTYLKLETIALLQGAVKQRTASIASANDIELHDTLTSGTLTEGYLYEILTIGGSFKNVGADNNDVGTQFRATGTTPTAWGGASLASADGTWDGNTITITGTTDINTISQKFLAYGTTLNIIAGGAFTFVNEDGSTDDAIELVMKLGEDVTVQTGDEYQFQLRNDDKWHEVKFAADKQVFASLADFPATGNEDLIYYAQSENLSYYWNGTTYISTNTDVPAGSLIHKQADWNAATNTPTITSSSGTAGYYHKVSVAGTTEIDGINVWGVDDLIFWNGTVWDKIDNQSTVAVLNSFLIRVATESELDAAVSKLNSEGGGQIIMTAAISLTANKYYNLNSIEIEGGGNVLSFAGYAINITSNDCKFVNVFFTGDAATSGNITKTIFNFSGSESVSWYIFEGCRFHNVIGSDYATSQGVLNFTGLNSYTRVQIFRCYVTSSFTINTRYLPIKLANHNKQIRVEVLECTSFPDRAPSQTRKYGFIGTLEASGTEGNLFITDGSSEYAGIALGSLGFVYTLIKYDGIDTSAIHTDEASEISGLTEKVAPVSADKLVIEDSADSNNKKYVQVANLPAGSATDTNAIHKNVNNEIAPLTNKTTPADDDVVLGEDSGGSVWSKIRITWGNIKGTLKSYFDTLYAAALGADDNYVTDAEKTVIGNTSGTNTGDQVISDATISTTDITTNNATTSKHGFLPKLGGGTTNYLRADGSWSTPAGGGGGADVWETLDISNAAKTTDTTFTVTGEDWSLYEGRALAINGDIPNAFITSAVFSTNTVLTIIGSAAIPASITSMKLGMASVLSKSAKRNYNYTTWNSGSTDVLNLSYNRNPIRYEGSRARVLTIEVDCTDVGTNTNGATFNGKIGAGSDLISADVAIVTGRANAGILMQNNLLSYGDIINITNPTASGDENIDDGSVYVIIAEY